MKICQVYEDYVSPAKDSMGAQRVCDSITKGLLQFGHEVTMKLHPDSKETIAPLVSDVPSDVDIIHFHQWEPGKRDYDKYGKPWVVTIHGGGSETDPTWIAATKDNPHVICVSHYIMNKVGAKASVHTSSDPDQFIFNPEKEDYFLWMAGTDWGEGKGLWSTIQIAKKLRINLKIAGTGQNQEIIEQIKKLCDDKIEYLGAINGKRKAEVLSKAKALILLTKLNDACPTTIGEAMLSGTPVIGSTDGSLPDLIWEGKSGFVCRSEVDIVRAIANVKRLSPHFCRELGERGFSNKYAAEKYLFYYCSMIKFGTVDPSEEQRKIVLLEMGHWFIS